MGRDTWQRAWAFDLPQNHRAAWRQDLGGLLARRGHDHLFQATVKTPQAYRRMGRALAKPIIHPRPPEWPTRTLSKPQKPKVFWLLFFKKVTACFPSAQKNAAKLPPGGVPESGAPTRPSADSAAESPPPKYPPAKPRSQTSQTPPPRSYPRQSPCP